MYFVQIAGKSLASQQFIDYIIRNTANKIIEKIYTNFKSVL